MSENKAPETVELIKKDMLIGDVVGKYPEAAKVMMEYGLHCVGCHASTEETLEEGILGHGMGEETLNKLMSDLNKVANQRLKIKEELKEVKIEVTDTAAEKVKEILKQADKPEAGIRIQSYIMGGGVNYEMGLEDTHTEEDYVTETKGVKIFIDPDSALNVNGVIIDYLVKEDEEGFKITHPETEEKGCGPNCGC